jgi:hypothetical protein
MKAAGTSHPSIPICRFKRHLSENLAEVEYTLSLYPSGRDYLDVYEAHEPLGPRSLMGNALLAIDDELEGGTRLVRLVREWVLSPVARPYRACRFRPSSSTPGIGGIAPWRHDERHVKCPPSSFSEKRIGTTSRNAKLLWIRRGPENSRRHGTEAGSARSRSPGLRGWARRTGRRCWSSRSQWSSVSSLRGAGVRSRRRQPAARASYREHVSSIGSWHPP